MRPNWQLLKNNFDCITSWAIEEVEFICRTKGAEKVSLQDELVGKIFRSKRSQVAMDNGNLRLCCEHMAVCLPF